MISRSFTYTVRFCVCVCLYYGFLSCTYRYLGNFSRVNSFLEHSFVACAFFSWLSLSFSCICIFGLILFHPYPPISLFQLLLPSWLLDCVDFFFLQWACVLPCPFYNVLIFLYCFGCVKAVCCCYFSCDVVCLGCIAYICILFFFL